MRKLRYAIVECFYKDTAYLSVIGRLSGVWLLLILPLELNSFFGEAYHVPSWRIGDTFFTFPEPEHSLSLLIWTLYFFASASLAAGLGGRWMPAFIFLVWLYYQSLERCVFQLSFVNLLAFYLVALSINREPRSLSRFLIQLAVSASYIFSALQKLHPEFISGLTLQDILGRGYLLRPELLPAIHWLAAPRWFSDLCGYLFVLAETFIGFGLWFEKTRNYAVFTGVILHSVLSLLIPASELLAPVIWTGYLAFFEKRGSCPSRNLSFKRPAAERLIAEAACLLCVILPWRSIFFLSKYDYQYMSLYDRMPAGMFFVFHEKLAELQVAYLGKDLHWHPVKLEGRMLQSSSDSDLLALLHYQARLHPEAKRIMLRCKLIVNSHGIRLKEFLYDCRLKRCSVRRLNMDGLQLHG